MPKKAFFTLHAPVNWPTLAMRVNDSEVEEQFVHRMVGNLLESAEGHNIIERIDTPERDKEGQLYVVLTLDLSTVHDVDKQLIALGVVEHLVAETRSLVH